MKTSLRIRVVLLAMAWVLGFPPSRTAQAARGVPSQTLAIVVNRSNPIDSLSTPELRKIFLGERSHWPNGHRIAVAMLENGPEREAVLRQIYRMSEGGYRNHFIKGIFRGEVLVSPKTLKSPVLIRKFIFNAPGAIGYLRSSDVDETVKVLRIDGHLPDDRDYRLQIDESGVR